MRFEHDFVSKMLNFPGIKSAKKHHFGHFWLGMGPGIWAEPGTQNRHTPHGSALSDQKMHFLCPFVPKHPIWPKLEHFRPFPDATKKVVFFTFFTTLAPKGVPKGAQPQMMTQDKLARTDPPLPRRKISARGVCFAPPLQSIYLSFSADLK